MNEFDQEGYREDKKKKSKLTMEQIILEQVKRVLEIGSKEFKGGYDEETVVSIDGQPQVVKKYIEDGRQAYCNAVLSLDVVASNWYGKTLTDKEKQKELLYNINEVKKKLKELYERYLEELKIENVDSHKVKYKYLSDKRKLCQELFSELILIIHMGKGEVVRDYDEEEENRYED